MEQRLSQCTKWSLIEHLEFLLSMTYARTAFVQRLDLIFSQIHNSVCRGSSATFMYTILYAIVKLYQITKIYFTCSTYLLNIKYLIEN